MKALSLRHVLPCGAAFIGSLAVCSVALHPSGPVKRADHQPFSISDLHPPPQVITVLNRSCMDCHSNRTVWPWYSYVAPMSWLVERDVRAGRDHLNFSVWDQYTFKEQQKLLADIASVIKNHEMPLPQYLLAHRDAKLSGADADLLYGWVRVERRRRKAITPLAPTGAGYPSESQ